MSDILILGLIAVLSLLAISAKPVGNPELTASTEAAIVAARLAMIVVLVLGVRWVVERWL